MVSRLKSEACTPPRWKISMVGPSHLTRHDGENCHQERQRQRLLIAVEAQARLRGIDEHHDQRNHRPFGQQRKGGAQNAQRRAFDGQTPGNGQHVEKNGVENGLLHPRRPLQQRKQRAGVFEDAGLADHVDLVVDARMDGQPLGFHRQQNEKSRNQEQMRRAPEHRRAGHQQMVDHEGQHGLRQQGDADEHHDQRGLGQNGEHGLTTRPQSAVGMAAVQPGEQDGEATQGENEPAAENVAHVGERQRIVGQHRNENGHREHGRERHDGRGPENPRSRLRHHDLFAQQLEQIAVRLKEAGAAAALHLLFHRDDETVQQRREQHNGQYLAHLLQDDVTAHGSSLS